MKKFYTIAGSAALALSLSFSATAQQQLPNAGFEEDWGACTPWTSSNNTKTHGTTPGSWTISQVIGIGGFGATTVGEKAEGCDSESAVKLYNNSNSLVKTQIVPGYVTLGKPWSTSVLGKENDGGTWGGVEFTARPKAIAFDYKRTLANGSDEPATVVAYLWKGTYTQKDVPGDIAMKDPKNCDMVDRDRNILGMETAKGGAVTKTDGAECIAKINYQIKEAAAEWKHIEIPFEYLSEATPEKINVIFSAGDYFSTAPVKDNSLTVDNVRLVYEGDIDLSAADKYPGTLTIEMNDDVIAEDQPATVAITYLDEDGKCDFVLPNFSLDIGMGPMPLGNIVVKNVSYAVENNVTHYTGTVKDFKLYEDQIVADIDLDGTIDSAGKAVMTINVMWTNTGAEPVPILVKFNGEGKPGKGTSGVASIDADNEEAVAEYYNLQGVRMNAGNLTPGLYIVRKGTVVSKIIVK